MSCAGVSCLAVVKFCCWLSAMEHELQGKAVSPAAFSLYELHPGIITVSKSTLLSDIQAGCLL